MTANSVTLYWDASAILSALLPDEHSHVALQCAQRTGLHLCSSLSFAEVHAVIARIHRQSLLTDTFVAAAKEAFASAPWRLLTAGPEPEQTERLAGRWSLKGADLWHLATAVTLRQDLPGLRLLTFDDRLHVAAEGEKIAANRGGQ